MRSSSLRFIDRNTHMQVTAKSQEEGEKPRKQAIVEVMVDLLLDMEGITVHRGLVYVLDEGLESYPVSGVGRRVCALRMYVATRSHRYSTLYLWRS